jgi:hypothetical protein
VAASSSQGFLLACMNNALGLRIYTTIFVFYFGLVMVAVAAAPPIPAPNRIDDWVDGSWTVDCSCGVTFDEGEEMVSCDECSVWRCGCTHGAHAMSVASTHPSPATNVGGPSACLPPLTRPRLLSSSPSCQPTARLRCTSAPLN